MSNNFVAEPDTPFSAREFAESTPHFYSRWSNPTVQRLETALATLERAEDALCFASGMAATTSLFLHYLRPGDHLLMSDVAYAGVVEFVDDTLAEMGINVTRADLSNPSDVEQLVQPTTKLIYAETPCNPILRLVDIEALSRIARRNDAILAIDSTLATPMATKPIELGADLVIHSLSKYLGGHGDAIGGAVVGNREAIRELRKDTGIHLGGTISPFNAWLILRGISTFPLRMRAHSSSATILAKSLESNPLVRHVCFPGLQSHPQFELAKRQMELPSGMLAVQLENGPTMARRLSECLRLFHFAVSLGHQRSLIWYIPTDEIITTSFRLNDENAKRYRDYAGDGIFRISVGLENPNDLCQDLAEALRKASEV